MTNKYDDNPYTCAVIYCRVSSKRQKIEGNGLDSQEHRCRQYAAAQGYKVEVVFPDDASGGGDYLKRPGLVALLSFLDAQPDKKYVVLLDDIKRFARDTEVQIKLRREFEMRGARVEFLNIKIERSPEGKFFETVFAAQGELEREQNTRQTIQKMTARLERGYWVFAYPVGYRYSADRIHGKILVRYEPEASIIQEGLEGFASGRFSTQSEVKRFFESKPDFPKPPGKKTVRLTHVRDILENPLYAGYVHAPCFGVGLLKGHHEPLISFETHERIQERLKCTAYAPARKDINADFPLRGFVLCEDCGKPLTSCWSKGRNKHYPYYLCDTPSCASNRKSIRRADIEEGAEALLRSLQPAKELTKLVRAMFIDAWNIRLTDIRQDQSALAAQINDVENEIEKLLDFIVNTSGTSVIPACEKKIDKLEREKIRLGEQAAKKVPPRGHPEEFIEPALTFLVSPWNLYKNGTVPLKRTVLKLAFSEPLRYCGKKGYRTAKTTLPFKVLAEVSSQKCALVPPHGLEPRTY